MDFKELGQALREERDRQGLSVEMVMETTKISRSNIIAIENGDRSSLPHPVYAKGFIKSYARFLGLDPDELSMVVDHEYQDEAGGPEEHIYEVSPAAEKAFQDREFPEKKSRSVWPLLLVLVALVVGGVLLFVQLKGKDAVGPVPEVSSEQIEQPDDIAPPPTMESVMPESDTVQPDDGAMADPDTVDDGLAADETQGVETMDEGTPAVEVAPEEEPVVVPEQSEPQAEQEPGQVEAEDALDPDLQKYEHVLIIRATTDKGCWIGVWKGDNSKMSSDFVLQKGEPLRLLFNSPRRVRIGNVAGVVVTYNGKPYQLDATQSNIQTLRFGY